MNAMTLERLQEIAKHDGYSFNLNLTTQMFPAPVPVRCDELTERHAAIINRIIDWNEMTLKAIKAVLLLDYVNQCGVTDWGHGSGRDNPFKIHTPDDAYAQARLKYVRIDRPERYKGLWSVVCFHVEWEAEHGAHVAMRGDWAWGIARDSETPLQNDFVR